jgi:uncharacterized protein YjbI with pentapeptide repeats
MTFTGKDHGPADFSKQALDNSDFSEATADGADFSDASLVRANLRAGSFQSTKFNRADMESADLSHADLTRAKFEESKLPYAVFEAAKLNQADLFEAVAHDARFDDAALKHASFCGANLTSATFVNADCRDSNWEKADLTDAFFDRTNLFEADLSRAKLVGAVFRNCELLGAKFIGADLRDADFSQQSLEGCDLTDAIVDGAKMPMSEEERLAEQADQVGESAQTPPSGEEWASLFSFSPSLDAVMDLVRCSDDMNIQCGAQSGYTPLSCAIEALTASKENIQIIEALLENGADPNGRGINGVNPLHLAARHGKMVWIDMLLDAGADVDGHHYDGGRTALICAARSVALPAAQRLVERGADKSLRCHAKGMTALEHAAKRLKRCQASDFAHDQEEVPALVELVHFLSVVKTDE